MAGSAKVWYELSCDKHGKSHKDNSAKVLNGDPPPHNRGLKETGCPLCKAERRKENSNK